MMSGGRRDRSRGRIGGRFRGCRRRALAGNHDLGLVRGTDPLALIVDVSEGVNGAEYVTGGGPYGVDPCDDVGESLTQVLVATIEKA